MTPLHIVWTFKVTFCFSMELFVKLLFNFKGCIIYYILIVYLGIAENLLKWGLNILLNVNLTFYLVDIGINIDRNSMTHFSGCHVSLVACFRLIIC